MRTQIESELKFSLSRRAYDSLRIALSPELVRRESILNWYWDTPNEVLRKSRASLRLRLYPDLEKAVWTVKRPAAAKRSNVPGLHRHEESETKCPWRDAIELAYGQHSKSLWQEPAFQQISRKLDRLNLDPKEKSRLRALYSMAATRLGYKHQRQLWELDAFQIGDRWHYELEIETTAVKSTRKEVERLFREHAIRLRPSLRSKLARVRAYWLRQR